MLPDGHVFTDRTAALLHGIDTFTWSEWEAVPQVETCAVRGSRPTKRRQAFGGTRTLEPRDIMQLSGTLVTTPLRTALDLGCRLHQRDALAALNAFARLHGITPAQLTAELPRYRGRRGVVQLRDLVPLVDPRIESFRESWVWFELRTSNLPAPVPQYCVTEDGKEIYRLDFAYPSARVAIEYDGEEFHSSDDRRRADEKRRAWLRRNGWTVIVVRKGDFTGRNLDIWIGKVRTALAHPVTNRRW
ncbi:endonuclease domain-containing protein [Nocardioides montaniterrae]